MFSKALERATKFTLPVMFTRRFRNGKIASGLGTFVIINRNGWIVTADHIVADLVKFSQSQQEMAAYEAEKKKIESDPNLRDKDKRRQIQRLHVSDEWITHQAVMWGQQNWVVNNVIRDELADVAIAKLENFDPAAISQYPVFKNPGPQFKPGTSLCRLGFPFHEIKASFVEAEGKFSLDPGTFPVALFPNDGILTRFFLRDSLDHSRQVRFIETSTPGLRGQSGGPIFDTECRIYAIQSQTISLPLGFAPTIKQGNREIVEHQFIHFGWGSDIANVINLLTAHGVAFATD